MRIRSRRPGATRSTATATFSTCRWDSSSSFPGQAGHRPRWGAGDWCRASNGAEELGARRLRRRRHQPNGRALRRRQRDRRRRLRSRTARRPACGNGVADGAASSATTATLIDADGCDANCTPTALRQRHPDRAANSATTATQTDGDGCDPNCTPTACGNGVVTTRRAMRRRQPGRRRRLRSATARSTGMRQRRRHGAASSATTATS